MAGRAGRRGTQGKVLIQTNNPQQKILQQVIDNDYQGLYKDEIKESEDFQYPPFSRLIRLTVKHIDEPDAKKAAEFLANKLAEKLSKQRVLGPEKPMVERIRNQFLFEIMIKLEKSLNLQAAKEFVAEEVHEYPFIEGF